MGIADPPTDRFRILCVDGGGMRGLLSVLVIADLERRLRERDGPEARLSDYFHLFAGTSTGGLIALALTAPREVGTEELVRFYREDGPEVFHRGLWQVLKTAGGFIGPKYGLGPLAAAVRRRLGDSTLSEATRDLLVTSYDMTRREPRFFKRWRARQGVRDVSICDAALSTSAAPTYFPSHAVEGENDALVDGGVFADNPSVAAIAEALGRNADEPARLRPEDLLLVSIGTGRFESGFTQAEVSGWGQLGWLLGGGDHPIISAMLGGDSDGTDYWAHMLLNHAPGEARPSPAEIGRDGSRFYRLQAALEGPLGLDDASPRAIVALEDAAAAVIEDRGPVLDRIAERLAAPATMPRND